MNVMTHALMVPILIKVQTAQEYVQYAIVPVKRAMGGQILLVSPV